MSVIETIEDVLKAPLKELGLNIVRVQIRGAHKKTLELMVERLDEKPVSMDDCVRASRESSVHLDIADPIEDSYVLEVTSPGPNRPLIGKEDFLRFIGKEIKLRTKMPIGEENQKRFKGKLARVEKDDILLEYKDESEEYQKIRIPLIEIEDAKLISTYSFSKENKS